MCIRDRMLRAIFISQRNILPQFCPCALCHQSSEPRWLVVNRGQDNKLLDWKADGRTRPCAMVLRRELLTDQGLKNRLFERTCNTPDGLISVKPPEMPSEGDVWSQQGTGCALDAQIACFGKRRFWYGMICFGNERASLNKAVLHVGWDGSIRGECGKDPFVRELLTRTTDASILTRPDRLAMKSGPRI